MDQRPVMMPLDAAPLRRYRDDDPAFDLYAADVAHSGARSSGDRGGGRRELLHPLRGGRARRALAHPGDLAARLLCSMPASSTASPVSTRRSGGSRRCPDLFNIMRAATVLAVSLLVLDYMLVAPNVYGTFFFGKITIVLYWVLQMVFLGGPRVAYRYFRYTRTLQHAQGGEATPTLVARARRRCRSAAARDRERRGQEDLAGRHPVAVAGRPRPGHPRHSRARRLRRSRAASSPTSRSAAPTCARVVLTPIGADAGGQAGSDADARAPARARRSAGCRRSTRAARRCGLRRSMSRTCCCGRASRSTTAAREVS